MVARTGAGVLDIFVDGVHAGVNQVGSSTTYPTAGISDFVFVGGGGGSATIAYKDVVYWDAVTVTESQALSLYNAGIFPEERTDARINRVLDLVGVPSSWRSLDAGPQLQQFNKSLVDSAALAHLQDCVDSDSSNIFMTGGGHVQFYSLAHPVGPAQAVFSNDGTPGTIPYSAGPPHIDDADIYNEVSVQGDSVPLVTLTDAPSQAAYGTRTLPSRSNVQLVLPTDSAALAATLLARYKTPTPRVPEITFTPQSEPKEAFTQATARGLLDRIEYRARGVLGPTIAQVLYIEGIHHSVKPGQLWETTFNLAPF
jgi:hypothetical protein